MRRKQLLVFLATVLAFSAIIFPAQATPKDADGEHKVYICHETGAEDKFVVIHVDVAAWDDSGDHPSNHSGHSGDYEIASPSIGCDVPGG